MPDPALPDATRRLEPIPAPDPEARAPFWTPGFAALMACALAALVVLLLLGNWQVRRLAWKEELLATIETRMAAAPRPLDAVLTTKAHTGDVDYVPVRAEGVFGEGEALVYATDAGTVGWQVMAPLRLADGRALIVNRGFVPDGLKRRFDRPQSLPPESPVIVTGLARNPLFEKPNRFVPENAPGDGEFYWKDFAALRAALGLEAVPTVPMILDVGPTPAGVLPRGGTTLVNLPNNHFGYAVTWYGIAVGLVLVTLALVRQRWRRARGARSGDARAA